MVMFVECVPEISVPPELGDVGQAVIKAGIWADTLIEQQREDPKIRAQIADSVAVKEGADVATMVDQDSEKIMAYEIEKLGYSGGIFSEEGLIKRPNHFLTLVLDGLDGTESAMYRPSGEDSAYGPSAGIFYDHGGVMAPLRGALFLPRQKKGIFGCTEKGVALEFRLEQKGEKWEVSGTQEIQPFDQEREDVKYIVSFFSEKGKKFPDWFSNLIINTDEAGDQNVLHASGAQVDYLTKLVENCGPRDQSEGPSVIVGSKGTKIHDVMGGLPAVLVLGGVVGNLDGYKISEEGFIPARYDSMRSKLAQLLIPSRYASGINRLAQIKQAQIVPGVSIGPLICAHNEKLYQRARDFMLGR